MKKCKDAKMQKLIKNLKPVSVYTPAPDPRGQHSKLWERAHPYNMRDILLSDPSPIIGYACRSLTHSLTH